jgi:adenine-specific DNA-methyltransferase
VWTPYHSKYWAAALTLRGAAGSIDTLSRSISNARVDLNPHQVDAALFALRSPLSKGVLLADEVGLGKTVEEGLVLAQRWAERRRRLLVIVPATLRKQWQQELEEKFHLPSTVLEVQAWRRAQREGQPNPFDTGDVVICSYHFASARAAELSRIPWDLVVIDEAHRLRNVYQPSNRMASTLHAALASAPKVLLTATPLQNSLLELYGLTMFVDGHVFGDLRSFKELFMRPGDEAGRNRALRERIGRYCTRTLRRHVLEYIRFTQRHPITQDFTPSDDEQALYDAVTAYLQRETLIALPAGQRTLLTMVMRKLLASSTFAIAKTLQGLVRRLEATLRETPPDGDDLADDYEQLDELAEELDEDDEPRPLPTFVDRSLLIEELAIVREQLARALAIRDNAKGDALLVALETAFDRATALGAARKAVVFTESRRTQAYLRDLLTANGHAGQVVCLDGQNTDPDAQRIYKEWKVRHEGDELVTGSRAVDIRAALIEEFRERASKPGTNWRTEVQGRRRQW